MPRKFTLAGLMIGVTVFCVLCGLLASNDEQQIAYALTVLALTPGGIVGLIFVTFAHRRELVLLVWTMGMVVGIAFAPGGRGPMTVWQAIGPVFIPLSIGATLGALLFGCIALALDPPISPRPPDQPPP